MTEPENLQDFRNYFEKIQAMIEAGVEVYATFAFQSGRERVLNVRFEPGQSVYGHKIIGTINRYISHQSVNVEVLLNHADLEDKDGKWLFPIPAKKK